RRQFLTQAGVATAAALGSSVINLRGGEDPSNVNAQTDAEALREEQTCDVVVIGAVLSGLRTALLLQAQGLNVLLVESDSGLSRTTADNSPPTGSPGILVGFIEETEALGFSALSPDQRQSAVAAEFARYFGPDAAEPQHYFEKNWGEDAFCRGIDGSYWS